MRLVRFAVSRKFSVETLLLVGSICAKRTVFDFIFWHIAEFASAKKNLLLIGTARSYLTVKLPNVDPETGGECG